MTSPAGTSRRIVILVDNRYRDLPGVALIAHHLRRLGVEPVLQPLEAYRAALGAFRPSMMVFNHLQGSHLVEYSHRLHGLGVKVGVLPNEGIAYDEDDLKFLSGKYHADAHVDHFFAWNREHARALRETGHVREGEIHVVGVPRFDFYFPPWQRLFSGDAAASKRDRPRILLCTNFVYAKFADLPREEGDKFFGTWKRMPKYSNPWEYVEIHAREREAILGFVTRLLESGRFDVTLRPHPLENAAFYASWVDGLPAEQRQRLRFDKQGNITELILDCDLEITCETCTTALESWLARKPTVEIALEKHPQLFHPEVGALNLLCERAEDLPGVIDKAFAGIDDALNGRRMAHLEKWCGSADGGSAQRAAAAMAAAVADMPEPDWNALDYHDKRRARKLHARNAQGRPYNHDPLLPVKKLFNPAKYAHREAILAKTIRPSDIDEWREKIEAVAKG